MRKKNFIENNKKQEFPTIKLVSTGKLDYNYLDGYKILSWLIKYF